MDQMHQMPGVYQTPSCKAVGAGLYKQSHVSNLRKQLACLRGLQICCALESSEELFKNTYNPDLIDLGYIQSISIF